MNAALTLQPGGFLRGPQRRTPPATRDPRPPIVPYPAAVTRPGWTHLPQRLRDEIDERSGQPVIDATPSAAGFSATFAAVLTHADGRRSFCKAAPAASPTGQAYVREALIVARLPADIPAARLRWHHHTDWIIAVYDAIDGASPARGWTSDPTPILAAVTNTAHGLTHVSGALRAAARPAEPLPAGWADIAEGVRPLPTHAAALAPLAPSMARWEADFLTAVADTRELAHYDVRPDNLMANEHGRVWLVDWATLRPGPSYVDTVMLAIGAADDGAEPQRFFDQAAPKVTGDQVDQTLAWLSGAWLAYAGDPPRPDAPHLRHHQLRSGLLAWEWLAHRHGLPHTPAFPTGAGHTPA
ncbi:hypothetical protein [Hamadaea tsunoensis]|uniref:hypothetical protein n=1 Tax=Hamadaea tsunoensis TaxID=53368 RepID=UPI000416EEC7|nr:hypothetical protein [Hamadaea tsunoensis]